jgi:hypothetical protein
MTRAAHENATHAIVSIAGNACAAAASLIRALHDRSLVIAIATRRRLPKRRCTDSESRILAIKKFSCSPASRLIGARQNRFFLRIACD